MVDIIILSEDQKKNIELEAEKMSKTEIESGISSLFGKDDKQSLDIVLKLYYRSSLSNDLYYYWDTFIQLLHSAKSTHRSRAIFLISINTKWDKEGKFEEICDDFLSHTEDEKSITSRQCIKSLENIIPYKENLHKKIRETLENINYENYTDAMKDLIFKDITNILNIL